ncbi:hypothetical protein DF185_22620 [Marinifilum breve]|uniref:Peptidase S74 domain-containing protein n=1 Tax=Marinifilum breve TaxID=2184082 RepID=A0A2V3ZR33_9BACT|nr:hypothetical protein [Marinifilum breve]PXX95176.1 hypothetical protein DF185_22620 [Marinifilum breve]
MIKVNFLILAVLLIAGKPLLAQTQVPENTSSPIFYKDKNVGIGVSEINAQLVVGSEFGALVSGSSGGCGVFGSNLAVYQRGMNHNQLFTPYNHDNSYGYSGMVCQWGSIYFHAQSGNTTANKVVSAPRMFIHNSGNIGIGTISPDYKLDVNGTIRTRELKVDMQGADFVFEDDYNLRSLNDLEEFIHSNKHLPDVAPAKEMQENGVNQSEMNQKLLQKIEELTLYILKQEKRINQLEQVLIKNHNE